MKKDTQTQTQHTPGPWEIAEYVGVTMIEHRAPTGYGYAQHQIARLEPLADEKHANARLIAAAPDMLAALRNAAELLGDDCPADIAAAIAKAEGRA